MPGSMYDRLGDMLSDALESGSFFADTSTAEHAENTEKDKTLHKDVDKSRQFTVNKHEENEKTVYKNTQDEKKPDANQKIVYKNRHLNTDTYTKQNTVLKKIQDKNNDAPPSQTATGMVYKALPPEVQKAFTTLGVAQTATLDEAKKAYHEKLKYYHPDRHGDNPVLQKVAREKTRQVIEAWNVLEHYFSSV